ncbi:MAG: hypothetical protein HQL09_01985, partial [Nitrospirae bacterium]|nr:hypothetical protein [Nitrospirota bacterium]
VSIEISNDDELKKIAEILKGQHITVFKSAKDRKKILEDIFNRYNVSLPKDYKFNREEIHGSL